MYVSYTDEQNIIRSMVRDFANNELEPTAAQRDEEERFDRDLFDKMGKLGLTGIPWPAAYGGLASDFLTYGPSLPRARASRSRARCGSSARRPPRTRRPSPGPRRAPPAGRWGAAGCPARSARPPPRGTPGAGRTADREHAGPGS